MLRAFFHLLRYAWENLVVALGTTTLSIILFSFVIPVLIFVGKFGINSKDRRKTGATMRQLVKGSLLSWQTIVPSLIYVVAWASLLLWSISTTAYRDHQALLGRIQQVRSENREIRQDRDDKISKLKEQLDAKPKIVFRTNSSASSGNNDKSADAEKKKRSEIRTHLGILLGEATAIKTFCLSASPPPQFSCNDSANQWQIRTLKYIGENLEQSYQPRFLSATGLTLSYNGAKSEEINSVANFLTFRAAILEQFIREFKD